MSIYKDNVTGKWRVVYRYTDWTGETHQSSKRGFPTKREAQMWERELLLKKEAKLDMTFESFYEIYVEDMQNRIRDNTWGTKTNIARTKILPYFGKRKIGEIEPRDIIAWQNELLAIQQPNGKPYSASYLQKIHSQLSAIFNHAVNFYHLPSNPAQKAGNMGKEEHREMLFWTKEEYLKFADVMMDKPVSYYAFEILYWCGLRMGELLALTYNDINLEEKTISINKSYQRLKGKDMITQPKTPKSIRVITMPDFLAEEFREYCSHLYGIMKKERLFRFTKSHMEHCMAAGIERSGVKRIRLHDLRHSHASMLVDMGVKFDMTCTGVRIFRMGKNFVPTGHKVRRKNYVAIFDKTAISNYCNSCLAGTCSGEYCAGVPGWIICWILLSDSRNLCCDRSLEHWVRDQYGLDNEISDHYDSSVYSTPTYRYGDSCSN